MDYASVPQELQNLRRWVVWGAAGAAVKAPRFARDPSRPASVTDPATWSDYRDAVYAVGQGKASGIGFVFNGDGYCGIDIDKAITPQDGISEEALEIVGLMDSYTEISPSGTGLHIIIKKTAPLAWNRRGTLEVYDSGRYFTVTGNALSSSFNTNAIQERNDSLLELQKNYPKGWDERKRAQNADIPADADSAKSSAGVVYGLAGGSAEVDSAKSSAGVGCDLAKGLKADKTFKELYEGARPNRNESADDLALMNKLAYWANKDKEAMLAAFLASPYFTQKDPEHKLKWNRADYRESTIGAAITGARATAADDDARFKEERARADFKNVDPASAEQNNSPGTSGKAPAKNAKTEKPKKNPIEYIRSYANLTVKEVSWLWYPYIPLGKLTVLQGDPGQGKTMFCCYLASIISTGGEFAFEESENPFEPLRTAGNVVFQSAEDSAEDTILPRMLKMGADKQRIFYIEEELGQEALTFLDERIEGVLKIVKPKLFILDPLQGFLGADVDMHRANEIRPVMARIGKLAEMYGCAFVIISHMNKDSQKSPIYRALGSIDIPAAARSVLAIAKNPKNDREKIFVHAKSSLARTGSALTFEINDDFGISITGQTDLDATDVLNPPVKRESPKLDFAKELIVRLLKEGTNNANDIIEEALKNGISEKTLKKARQELGVVVKKVGFNKNRVSWWELKDE